MAAELEQRLLAHLKGEARKKKRETLQDKSIRALAIARALERLYTDVDCPLTHRNNFELLCAVILSAQCTDAAVNKVTPDLFRRLLSEEYDKLCAADNRDVHNDSKQTTLPIARQIVETYVLDPTKLPWYIDLLNITLGVEDLAEAKRRIALMRDAFKADGRRITENLDFNAA